MQNSKHKSVNLPGKLTKPVNLFSNTVANDMQEDSSDSMEIATENLDTLSECDSTSSIDNQQSSVASSHLIDFLLGRSSATSITASTVNDTKQKFLPKHGNNMYSIFQNEKLQNELVTKLILADINDVRYYPPNTKMARSFNSKERSQIDKARRERNTEAARASRRRRQIFEKVVSDMTSEKEEMHNKLITLKAAMINYNNELNRLIEMND